MKKSDQASALVIVLSLLLSFSMFNLGLSRVKADNGPALLQLIPSSINVQNTSQPFILNLTITNVTDLYGWGVRIYFENAVLNFVDASDGAFLSSAGATNGLLLNVNNGFNATHGTALLGESLEGLVGGASGSGVLATLTFQSVGGGNATVHIDTDIQTGDTSLLDSNGNPLPYTTADAAVSITVFRNVSVMNVLQWKTVVGQGLTGNVSVTVADTGTVNETFNATVYFNSTAVANQTVTLANGTSQTTILVCNTSAITKGRYVLSATVPPLQNEINSVDNTYVDGWINMTIPGDIDGNFWVQLADLVLLANAYGTTPLNIHGTGHHQWNPNADVDNNGVVGLSDLVLLATHYGQKV